MSSKSDALVSAMRERAKDASEEEPANGFGSDVLAGVSIVALAVSLGVSIFVLMRPQEVGWPGLALMAGVAAFLAVFLIGVLSRSTPSGLMFDALWGRLDENGVDRTLAGGAVLRELGLSDRILHSDPDAVLITRRDGVVAYANPAYRRLAKAAGVSGLAGLPPRIDRLFAQAGEDGEKIFRLCKAAKSGTAAGETVSQFIGAEDAPRRRAFHIRMRPVAGADDHVYWRLQEADAPEAEETHSFSREEADALPVSILAVDRKGGIVWANAAAQGFLSAPDADAFADIAPEGADGLIDAFFTTPGEAREAVVASKDGPADVVISPFFYDQQGEARRFLLLERAGAAPALETKSGALGGHVQDAPFGVAVIDGDPAGGKVLEANRAFATIFGSAAIGAKLSDLFEEADLKDLAALARRKGRDVTEFIEARPKGADGIVHLYARSARRKRGEWGARKTLLFALDVTQQKRMEDQYAQGQKLAAVGKLAGGVAHDFNNILTVIIGNCDMLMTRHAVGDPSYPDLVQIQQNANRAAALVRKLLAFSRKQTLTPEVLNVTDVLQDFSPFLHRTITEKVKLKLVNGRDLFPIKADRGQIEVAIMNLAVNARDAMMPAGGALTIETKNVAEADVAAYGYDVIEAKDYVLIEVSDTGEGISPEIADKIFEPFFTTKEVGKGTGLGLSTVYGIVKQTEGFLFLESDVGKGATFRIFLPAHDGAVEEGAAAPAAAAPEPPEDLTGHGKILVVEDEDPVRSFVVRALQTRGYEVLEAADGEEALEVIEDHAGEIDLMVSDIMMPGLDGPGLLAKARDKLGKAKVVFISGYAEAQMRDQMADLPDVEFLPKPFTLKTLAAKVKEVLNAE